MIRRIKFALVNIQHFRTSFCGFAFKSSGYDSMAANACTDGKTNYSNVMTCSWQVIIHIVCFFFTLVSNIVELTVKIVCGEKRSTGKQEALAKLVGACTRTPTFF